MIRQTILILLLTPFTNAISQAQTVPLPRERILLDADWRFQKNDPADSAAHLSYVDVKDWIIPTGSHYTTNQALLSRHAPNGIAGGAPCAYSAEKFDDSQWRRLDLPHDWAIEGPFKQAYNGETGKLPFWGVGWYRKHFSTGGGDRQRRILLDIDGAMSYAMVWINGHFAGGWPYGYASWQLDVTPWVKFGADNVIAIRLDNPPESSRWYPGGGIYRNVWLEKTSPVHIKTGGTQLTTPRVSPDMAEIALNVSVQNDSGPAASITAHGEIRELNSVDDGLAAEEGMIAGEFAEAPATTIPPGGSAKLSMTAHLPQPRLWSVEHPNLYEAVITLEQEGKVIDRVKTPFGARTAQFTADNGFLLNGWRVHLNGVCDHHDLGPLGAALNMRALQRQLEILREMGCNALRTSHNPPAPELLDLCDRMGFLVMDESFDCWERAKKTNDYHLLFHDWHEKDWRSELRRDRNHPSVVLWSIGNEVPEQATPRGKELAAELVAIAHEEDPTRPVTTACDNPKSGSSGLQNTVDVFGYNYKPKLYGKLHEANPTLPIFGSETSSGTSSRGEYFFPLSTNKIEGRANFQVSSYDLYSPIWATTAEVEFHGQDQYPFTAGEFVWTGFDYLGEPTPYSNDATNLLVFTDPAERARHERELAEHGKIQVPSRSSYFGIIDLDGFKKDRFYLYQARWRPDYPMAHILPHWNWPERLGLVTPVHVYTSGDEAELFLNGKSLGRKKKAKYQYRLRWDDVTYEPGALHVIAYKDGRQWAEDTVETAGPEATLGMTADRSQIRADGRDLSFITVSIKDSHGRFEPRAHDRVHFQIEGPGEIVATDNGDPTDLEIFHDLDRNAFNGLCLAIVRSIPSQPGAIVLKAEAAGLEPASLQLQTLAAPPH